MCSLFIGTMLQACMITFLNDSSGKLGIFNKLDETFTFIPKNGRRRFGQQHEQAHFVLYTQRPKTKVAIWVPLYTCKQNRCSSQGNVILKFSDLERLEQDNDAHNLFTIIKHKPYSPMVKELPMIQGCAACGNE